ncbi:MAG: ribonuclease HI family protein [Ignavibacteriales bacterium]|nr:ribonuclease HI family protein [Ignavibacteriales bacterium]
MTLTAYTDGASRGNPGEGGIGIMMKDGSGNVVASFSDYVGRTTNNQAEYLALLACLRLALETKCTRLVVYSDSELMVRQVQGTYKVKDADLKSYFTKIQKILGSAPFTFEIKHITREENRHADELANRGINLRRRVNDPIELN